jgi:hypothetical protein
VASDAEVKKAMDVEDSITEMLNDIHKERVTALAQAAKASKKIEAADRKAASYLAELEALRAKIAQLKGAG